MIGAEIEKKLRPLFDAAGLRLVVLFGSMATGKITKWSDIDLGFLFDEPVDIVGLTNRVITLLHSDKVDVVDLRRASPLLKFSAAKYGKALYERSPGLFNQFCSLAMRRFADTKKIRVAQERVVEDFLREKGLR